MTTETASSRPENRKRGYEDEELATLPTVYRDGILQGKSFLVSGGGSGIGRGTAVLLTRLGADVMICGRSEERLRGAAASIGRLLGREPAYRAMSIRNPEEVDATIAAAYERMGGLDVLVNNAGGQFAQNAIDFSRKGWNAVVDTNLNGTWYMMQAAAQKWRELGRQGNIVNIVSTVERGLPQQAHSCAARAGVIHLSRTVALEWAPLGIRVNCIAPGTIETTGLNNYPPEMLKSLGRSNPLRAMGDVWDIAQAIVYLAGETGKFMTGELMHVNGGSHLWGNTWPLGMPDHFRVD